jgi:hypothetical protein
MVMPSDAVTSFGLQGSSASAGLPFVIGLRDVWLAVIALAFLAYRDWRALALWCGAGSVVCAADAMLVAVLDGPISAVAFHAVAAGLCAVAGASAVAYWRQGLRTLV